MHNVMDTASSAPATKRVRWDESVPQEPVAAGVADSGAADGEANAVVSCSASEAIRLVSGEAQQSGGMHSSTTVVLKIVQQ